VTEDVHALTESGEETCADHSEDPDGRAMRLGRVHRGGKHHAAKYANSKAALKEE
jgi:hypothetical protein